MLNAYRELWQQEPMMRRLLVVALLADIAFGALVPFVNLYLTAELKAPERVTGTAFAGYFAVEMLLKTPFGALSDRIGRKPVLLLGIGITVTIEGHGFTLRQPKNLRPIGAANSRNSSLRRLSAQTTIAVSAGKKSPKFCLESGGHGRVSVHSG